ncbi:MAG TPA: hypothetical protein VMD30_11785 [Tepidisphaeraceae bacterium]|nr:hypothetical protein [Tepidisphaeraceae bacterium]
MYNGTRLPPSPHDPQPPPVKPPPSRGVALLACAVGVAGNILGMLTACTLLTYPPGATSRPMGLVSILFLIALATAMLGLTAGIFALVISRRHTADWIIAAVGMILSLTPFFSSMVVWRLIAARRGLIFN